MKFKKKPIIVEAEQYDRFAKSYSPFLLEALCSKAHYEMMGGTHVHTLEGIYEVKQNDWIIKGIKGEFYPCDNEIFELTYEKV